MPERPWFKPETSPTPLESALEKTAFLEQEKEERRRELIRHAELAAENSKNETSKKMHLEEAKKWAELPDDEMYSNMLNNIHCWLPPVEAGGTCGAYRTPEMMEIREEEMPERHEAALKLIKDVDEYLDEHGLRERARQIADQQARNVKLMKKAADEAFKTKNPDLIRDLVLDQTISDKEMLEFKKDLYYAMRKKGHTGVELRT